MPQAAKCGCNTDSNGIVGFILKPETLKTWAIVATSVAASWKILKISEVY